MKKEQSQAEYNRRWYRRRKTQGWRTFSYMLPVEVHSSLTEVKNRMMEQWKSDQKSAVV